MCPLIGSLGIILIVWTITRFIVLVEKTIVLYEVKKGS